MLRGSDKYVVLWRLSLSEECFIRLAGDEPGAGGLKRPDSYPSCNPVGPVHFAFGV